MRALSLMRILMGALLLTDLLIRASSLTAHYTGQGVVPFNEVGISFWRNGFFSLYQFSDQTWFVALLFFITGLVYICLLLGYRTRIFSVLAWLLLLSLQNRNMAVLQCGDDELRLILFWGIFLPWGNFYSVDARRYRGMQKETVYFDVPGLAYVLLIFSVYFFTGILKTSAEWDSSEGSAFYYALSLDEMVWPLGKMLLPYTGLLKTLTIAAKWIEICVPFLLFIPFRNAACRMVLFFIFTAFHIAIGLTLFVGLFSFISIFSLAGLLSPKVMDRLEKLIRIKPRVFKKDDLADPADVIGKNYYFRVIRNCFVFFCLALCFIWNLGNLENRPLKISDRFFKFGFMLRLDQRWNMFAPSVVKDDGWFIMDGLTPDKRHIDINRQGAAVDYAKPDNVLRYIKDDRWRKYQENYVMPDNLFLRHYYCEYLIKDWNTHHPENPVDTLSVVYMKEFTLPPGQKQEVVKADYCKCWK